MTQTSKSPGLLGFAGWSGAGKTTLLRQLIPALTQRGVTVSTIKHAHHNFDVDKPGKDSYEHRQAGAGEVLISSANRWALMHEHRGAPEPTLWDLLPKMSPVDLVLVEGFKKEGHEKLEVHRPALGKPLLSEEDDKIIAVLTDDPNLATDLPKIDLNDIEAIADFVCQHCGLGGRGC